VAQDLPGRSGAQFVAVVDPAAAGQRRGDQRHRLVAGVGPPGRVAELDAFVDQFPQPQPTASVAGSSSPASATRRSSSNLTSIWSGLYDRIEQVPS
jgi:hypothetical protein